MKQIRFIDLFAGIGGFRLAFESENIKGKCVFSSEWDESCKKTYEANFHETPYGDITKVDPIKDIPDFDILTAGFPCQPFSSIGKREGFMHATQGTLFFDVLRILKEKRGKDTPKAFLLENVIGLTTHEGGNTLLTILKALEEIGYTADKAIIDGADFGVPQHRRRIYIVGFRKDLVGEDFRFNFPTDNGKIKYIGEILEESWTGYSISKHLQDVYLFKKKDGRPTIVDKNSKFQIKTLVSTYHKIQRLTGTFVKDGETGLRLFTANECKAIMGFEQDFIIPVSRTQMYHQLGNSVVVPAVTAIAEKMAEVLKRY